jgi:hypothetical protein
MTAGGARDTRASGLLRSSIVKASHCVRRREKRVKKKVLKQIVGVRVIVKITGEVYQDPVRERNSGDEDERQWRSGEKKRGEDSINK